MIARIKPSKAVGRITAPPSKSIAHRLIIAAALSEGISKIRNVSLSEDIRATLSCIEAFGARYLFSDGTLTIHGVDPANMSARQPLNCGESGSTLRFLLPVCALNKDVTLLNGSERLLQRPLGVYEELCRSQGINYKNTGSQIEVGGSLHAGTFEIPGNISSQFVTGLLFALPLVNGDSKICLTGEIESRSYINLTLNAQSAFGINNIWLDDRTLLIHGNAKYSPSDVINEGDWSNAAFYYALNEMGAQINVEGLVDDSAQGDRICTNLFAALRNDYCELDLSDCPDLGPILFAFAAANHGARFTGTRRLRMKESDRIAAMAQELARFGCQLEIGENTVFVPGSLNKPTGMLCGHNDHRIVMSLAVLCTRTGGEIEGAQAVNKSYPEFFEDLKKLQVNVEYEAG